MEDSLNNLVGLSGLVLGVLSYILIGLFVRKKYKKQRIFDERYYHIHHKAKSLVWDINMFALIIIWAFVVLYDGIGFSFFLMTAIYIIHNVAYLITAAYYARQVE